MKSLTVDTVVHEVFSAFSAAFEEVRKVELQYMSEHWNDIRKGAMLNIGQFIRSGRYPGFDEGALILIWIRWTCDPYPLAVWPVIIQNLITEEKKGEGEQQPVR